MTEVVPVSNSLFPAVVAVCLTLICCRICCQSFSGRRQLRSLALQWHAPSHEVSREQSQIDGHVLVGWPSPFYQVSRFLGLLISGFSCLWVLAFLGLRVFKFLDLGFSEFLDFWSFGF